MEAVKIGEENNFSTLKTILIIWIYIKTFLKGLAGLKDSKNSTSKSVL